MRQANGTARETRTRRHGTAALVATCALVLAASGAAAGCGGTASEEAEEQASVTQVGSVELECVSELADVAEEDIQSTVKNTVYDEDNQQAIADELEAAKDGQTLEAPLVEYNPFGSNTLSLYVYFVTDEDASVSYTVSVADEDVAAIGDESLTATSIADFTREVDDGAMGTEHEFAVMGLIGGIENTVTLTATYGSGDAETCVITAEMCELVGDEALQLEVEDGESDAELEDGLYVILGNDADVDFMYYYDNDGILRGEVPVIGYRSHRMLFDDEGTMYYSCSQSRMAAMNGLGQITRVYFLGDYDLHHDYVFGAEGQLLLLASDMSDDTTTEDLVASLDLETGDVSIVVDMRELMADYCEQAVEYYLANNDVEADEDYDGVDWTHLNSIVYLEEDDAIIVSSRETSSIMKISGVYSGQPEIVYLLSSEEYWEGTAYESLVYEQVGDFLIHGGQHCLEYEADESLEDGQYYLSFFNNNIGMSSTSDFDYSALGIATPEDEDAYSYYYKYLVDENAGTFELVDSLEVPYSGYVSSVQQLDGTLIVDSGIVGTFTEYDADHVAIRTFSMGADKFIYRVFKYDL